MSQCSASAVSLHDFSFAGASPNHSATSALAFGLMMWFIHMYMQFGCSASELIIHVSDHPVAPSSGRTFFSGSPSALSRFVITCQVVPTDESPLANAWIVFV